MPMRSQKRDIANRKIFIYRAFVANVYMILLWCNMGKEINLQ